MVQLVTRGKSLEFSKNITYMIFAAAIRKCLPFNWAFALLARIRHHNLLYRWFQFQSHIYQEMKTCEVVGYLPTFLYFQLMAFFAKWFILKPAL
jgi:hypothetical protein